MTGLNWFWIGVAIAVPGCVGAICAWPLWRIRQPILGSLVGSVIVFGSALALIMREHAELDRATRACLEQGTTCWPDPSAFTRFAIYAFIGLFQVIVLFSLGAKVDATVSRRTYAPEWR